MGHNLGMNHDCINFNCNVNSQWYRGPRELDGKECFGYMDYKDDTNYWSHCSVSDLTDYINTLPGDFCLPKLSRVLIKLLYSLEL